MIVFVFANPCIPFLYSPFFVHCAEYLSPLNLDTVLEFGDDFLISLTIFSSACSLNSLLRLKNLGAPILIKCSTHVKPSTQGSTREWLSERSRSLGFRGQGCAGPSSTWPLQEGTSSARAGLGSRWVKGWPSLSPLASSIYKFPHSSYTYIYMWGFCY